MHSSMLEELLINNNDITTEGAHLILQSAVNNEVCRVKVVINAEYQRDSKVRKMMNILRERRMMNINVVCYIFVCSIIIIIINFMTD